MKDKNIHLTPKEQYLKSLKAVSDLYLFTLIICGAIVLGGIIFAVMSSVFVGLLVCISAILIYIALTSNLLYKFLGISYKSSTGQLTVTNLYGKGREEIWIPRRLIMLDVTEIGDNAFKHKSSAAIAKVHLPSTLKVIGENVFADCEALTAIYFEGSEAEWEAIEKHTDLSAFDIVFLDGEEKETGAEQSLSESLEEGAEE